jgi:3-methylcrotonyl-CoA carboxylase alpha subunit
MFEKVLIANRGEIACRVIRTAKKLGIKTVAVYSDADRQAQHVKLADEAVHLGDAPAKDSYLVIDKVLDAARKTGAQAIHPGYGFLSENAEFSDACNNAGIKFIGPSGYAISAMGSKSKAKALMEKAGVPLVPGYHGDIQAPDVLKQHAIDIGFPLLIKASAGGGGKGMRVVDSLEEFTSALEAAKREAKNAFGDDHVLLERYVLEPRHVEIQVFCDQFEQGVYLFERDCSIQRRHQKVVEEAPAPGVSDELRQNMGEAALRAAHAIGYEGAGTVEFLLDASGEFYFMEMNTRLQVEHPVTEMISGIDLVAWQFKVAEGDQLPLTQKQLSIRGHAIEVRLYAEDPDNDFLPSVGRIDHIQFPSTSHKTWARVDAGVVSGDQVTMHYDPMIAKVVAWGEDRLQAISRLKTMLQQTYVVGPVTNRDYLLRILSVPAFSQAELTTHFIEHHQDALQQVEHPSLDLAIAICSAWFVDAQSLQKPDISAFTGLALNKSVPNNWRLNLPASQSMVLKSKQANYPVTVSLQDDGYQVARIGKGHLVKIERGRQDDHHVWVDGQKIPVHIFYQESEGRISLFIHGVQLELEQAKPDLGLHTTEDDSHGVVAPMHGNVVAVLVTEDENVVKGQPLIVMEAMKMEHTLTAPYDAVVSSIRFHQGQQVGEGEALIDLEALAELNEVEISEVNV